MENITQRVIRLYEQIEKAALQQAELAESGQSLEKILNPLQELINQWQEYMDEIDQILSGLNEKQKSALAEHKGLEATIRRILNLDSQSQKKLQEILKATSGKLGQLQDMKKANRAYGGQDEPTEAWFFDRKG